MQNISKHTLFCTKEQTFLQLSFCICNLDMGYALYSRDERTIAKITAMYSIYCGSVKQNEPPIIWKKS